MLRQVPGKYSEHLQRNGFEIKYPPLNADTTCPEVLAEQLQGCDAMLASTEKMTARSSRIQPCAWWRGWASVSIPSISPRPPTWGSPSRSRRACWKIRLRNIRSPCCWPSHSIVQRDREVRAGAWSRQPLPRLAGKTFGLVGMGRIGLAVVPRVRGLGMKIVAHDPFADADFAAANDLRLVPLAELLATADVVSLHAPCTAATENMMNAASFRK